MDNVSSKVYTFTTKLSLLIILISVSNTPRTAVVLLAYYCT